MAGCVDDVQDPAVWYIQKRLSRGTGVTGNLSELGQGEKDHLARQRDADAEVGRDPTGLCVLYACRTEPELAGLRLRALAQTVRNEPVRMPRYRRAGFFSIAIDRVINAPAQSSSLYVRSHLLVVVERAAGLVPRPRRSRTRGGLVDAWRWYRRRGEGDS